MLELIIAAFLFVIIPLTIIIATVWDSRNER